MVSGVSDGAGVGPTFTVAEEDYLYGIGPIVVRVISVVGRVAYRGEPWWLVVAHVANGVPENHGGWQEREIYLRSTVVTGR